MFLPGDNRVHVHLSTPVVYRPHWRWQWYWHRTALPRSAPAPCGHSGWNRRLPAGVRNTLLRRPRYGRYREYVTGGRVPVQLPWHRRAQSIIDRLTHNFRQGYQTGHYAGCLLLPLRKSCVRPAVPGPAIHALPSAGNPPG